MARMVEFEVQGRIPAPVETVWNVFTDHVGWQDWAGVKEVVLRQQGDPPPNGLGAIRVVRSKGIAVEEEITEFDPPKRMVYRLVAGAPVRDHRGEVRFEEIEDGDTRVIWTVRFRPRIPFTGGLLRRAIESTLRDVLLRLARHCMSR
jgi:uncharacterized protein YndB with AHSA1/START domain